jgi:hypothetical protein
MLIDLLGPKFHLKFFRNEPDQPHLIVRSFVLTVFGIEENAQRLL